MKIQSYLYMKFSCKNSFRCLSYVPLNLLFLFNWWLEQICLICLWVFYVSFKFHSSKHAILYIAPSVKLERRQSICAIFRATTTGNLTSLTQYRGSTRISRERAGIQPHTITAPPPKEHTPKQPCIWTRTAQIIHTIYLVITIRYFANSFRYS